MTQTYIIVDLECTCWESNPLAPNETIEIGAVAWQAGRGVVDEFTTFAKPKMQPVLSEFCKSLTTIQQSDVDHAPGFPEAYANWRAWAKPYEPYIFASCGDFDHNQLKADCRRHGFEHHMTARVNLKKALADATDGKRRGMASAMEFLGRKIEGTHHRGIDDARNIAHMLAYLVENAPDKLAARVKRGDSNSD